MAVFVSEFVQVLRNKTHHCVCNKPAQRRRSPLHPHIYIPGQQTLALNEQEHISLVNLTPLFISRLALCWIGRRKIMRQLVIL